MIASGPCHYPGIGMRYGDALSGIRCFDKPVQSVEVIDSLSVPVPMKR